MRSRFQTVRRVLALSAGTAIGLAFCCGSAEAAVAGAAIAIAPGALGMGWLVGLAIFPPAALLALTFTVALLTDRLA